MMRLEITGGKGMTPDKYVKVRDDLHAFFKRFFHGYWQVLDTSLSDEGMVYVAWGRIPINDSFTDGIAEVVSQNGYKFGYGEDDLLMGLFPG